MIFKYDFKKIIKKSGKYYNIEIFIPYNMNDFQYEIYGDYGYLNNGSYSSFKNINIDNILVICVDKPQTLFLNIIIKNNNKYFDFINMFNFMEDTCTKNIKININRKSDASEEEIDDLEEEDDSDEEEEDDSEEEADEADEEEDEVDEEEDADEADETYKEDEADNSLKKLDNK